LISLKKLNRQVLAKTSNKRALTDKQARAKVAQLHADGVIDARAVKGVESTLRQARRENAKYEKRHAHIGADPTEPTDDYLAPIGRDDSAEAKRAQAIEGHAGAARTGQSAAIETAADVTERQTFGDGVGADNLDDSESMPQVRTAERVAQQLKERSQRARDDAASKLAWAAFELEHTEDAAEIDKVWKRSTQRTQKIEGSDPAAAFSLCADSFVQNNVRTDAGRAQRRGMLAESWKRWADYLETWKHEHRDAQLPDDAPAYSPRSLGAPEAMHAEPSAVYRGVERPATHRAPVSRFVPVNWVRETQKRIKASGALYAWQGSQYFETREQILDVHLCWKIHMDIFDAAFPGVGRWYAAEFEQ
jgi:hypothetical protein